MEKENRDPRKQRSWKTWLLDWNLQMGYLSLYIFMFSVFIMGFITLNFIFVYHLAAAYRSVGKEIHFSQDLLPFLLLNGALIGFVAAAMAIYSVIHSHRIAGPVYRLKKTFERMLEGDHDFSIKFRERDFFHDLATMVNQLNESLHLKDERIYAVFERLTEIRQEVETEEDLEAQIDELEQISLELADILDEDPAAVLEAIQEQRSATEEEIDETGDVVEEEEEDEEQAAEDEEQAAEDEEQAAEDEEDEEQAADATEEEEEEAADTSDEAEEETDDAAEEDEDEKAAGDESAEDEEGSGDSDDEPSGKETASAKAEGEE